MRIAAFVSGNLAAETMAIVIARVAKTQCHEVRIISDGYYPAVRVPTCHIIDALSPTAICEALAGCDFLLTSIRSPGTCERLLVRCARDLGMKSLVVLADLGSGAQKFRESKTNVLPTSIAVSDEYTCALLRSQGIPSSVLAPIGSPYLDRVFAPAAFRNISPEAPTKLALLSLPNLLDFATWGTPYLYTEDQVATDCISLVNRNPRRLLDIRLHPKETVQRPKFAVPHSARVRTIDASPQLPITAFVCSHDAIISTYSTGLLVGGLLGAKAISYQPTPLAAVREGFYRHIGLPIARDVQQLEESLNTPDGLEISLKLRSALYNFGSSTERLLAHIEQLS